MNDADGNGFRGENDLPEDVKRGGVESPDKELLRSEGLDDDGLPGSGQVGNWEVPGKEARRQGGKEARRQGGKEARR